MGLNGANAGLLHDPKSREDVPIRVQLDRPGRSAIESLISMRLPTANGGQVSIAEVTDVKNETIDVSSYGKNMRPVVYVLGDVAGEVESPVYAIMAMNEALDKLKTPQGYGVKRYNVAMPEESDRLTMKWDGEWHITIEVFRDLGLAFAAVLVLIYVLVVGWFRSFVTPLGDLQGTVDLTLAFYVLHEFPDYGKFFTEVAAASKPGAMILLAEPKGHVKPATFDTELEAAAKAGFTVAERPVIRRSLTALLKKP